MTQAPRSVAFDRPTGFDVHAAGSTILAPRPFRLSTRRRSRPRLPATVGRRHETAHAQENQPLVAAPRTALRRRRRAPDEAHEQAATGRQASGQAGRPASRHRASAGRTGTASGPRPGGQDARHVAPFHSAGPSAGRYVNHLAYALYLPAAPATTAGMPVVVMLHGCKQSAESFAAGTRICRLAERSGFAVLFPRTGQDRACAPLLALAWRRDGVGSRGRHVAGRRHRATARLRPRPDLPGRHVRRSQPPPHWPSGIPTASRPSACTPARPSPAVVDVGGDEPDAPGPARRPDTRGRCVRRRRVLSRHAGPVMHGALDTVVTDRNATQLGIAFARLNRLVDEHGAMRVGEQRTYARDDADYVDYLKAGRLVVRVCIVRRLPHAWAAATRASRFIPPRGRTPPRCSGNSFVANAASGCDDVRQPRRPTARGAVTRSRPVRQLRRVLSIAGAPDRDPDAERRAPPGCSSRRWCRDGA